MQNIKETNLGKAILSYISLNKDYTFVEGAFRVEDENHKHIVVIFFRS